MKNNKSLEMEKLINLHILTQFYPPDYAATGQLIEELAFHLGNLGLAVQIFTSQPGYAFQNKFAATMEQKAQVMVQRSRTAGMWPQRIRGKAVNAILFCMRSGLHLLKLILSQIFDRSNTNNLLLVTTAPPFLPILGYLAHILCGFPYVCLLYDLYPDVAVELNVLSNKNWLVRFWDFINVQIWKNATNIIVLSPSMKERVVGKCPEITDKITIIHNWADPNWIVPIAKQNNWFAKQFNLVKKFTVLYSGNMGRCHDMDTILEAATILNNEAIQFVFIGNGAKRSSFIEQVNQLGLSNCQFLPYQNKENLPYSLTACDLSLVSISPGMEGLVVPSKFYAALAAGRPIAIIGEKYSYLRQLVSDINCGCGFANGDAIGLADFIRHLANNTQIAEKMGNTGRRYLESNFTPEIIAKQYAEIFWQALEYQRGTIDLIDREVFGSHSSSIPKQVKLTKKPLLSK